MRRSLCHRTSPGWPREFASPTMHSVAEVEASVISLQHCPATVAGGGGGGRGAGNTCFMICVFEVDDKLFAPGMGSKRQEMLTSRY